jgi:hypothetical protein
MPWVDIPMATGIGEDSSAVSYGSDTLIKNLEVLRSAPGSRSPFYLRSVPALSAIADQPGGAGAIFGFAHCPNVFSGGLAGLAIRGTTIYHKTGLMQVGAWSSIGTIPSATYCRILDVGTHAVISGDGFTRLVDPALTVTTPSKSDFVDAAYQDGFTLYAEDGSDELYASNSDDPSTIDLLKFTTVDSQPGENIGLIMDHREIFAFKGRSIEHYYNDGSGGFPFARSSPGMIERGIHPLGRLTIDKFDNAIYWLGDDLRVYRMRGLQPERISSPWVEKRLVSRAAVAPGIIPRGFVFRHAGQSYYLVDISNSTGEVLVYNIDLGTWHLRVSGVASLTPSFVAHTPATSIASVGTYFSASDYSASSTGSIYQLASTITTDSGAASPSSMVLDLPMFAPGGGRRITMHELYVDMNRPTGTATLTWSDDAGATYTGSLAADTSQPGVRFQRLGSFRQRLLRLTLACTTPAEIVGVRARIEECAT